MSNYTRRGRYLVARNGSSSSRSGSVRRVTGRDGQMVTRLGPSFAEGHEVIEDPKSGLIAGLESQKRARQSS